MNTAMLMDFYEMTMANGYFMDENLDKESKVAFDVFYRRNPDKGGYAVFAGLEQIIQYILNLHFEEKDIELCIDGMGIVFFSPKTTKDIPEGIDFFNQEYSAPADVSAHLKKEM